MASPRKYAVGEMPPDEEKQSLIGNVSKPIKTYRQFCCCSLGTAATVWAVFLLALSAYVLFDNNVKGAAFTAGSAVGLVTAVLILSAIGYQNAFPAFVAVYTQISLFILWALQLVLSSLLFREVLEKRDKFRETYTAAAGVWENPSSASYPSIVHLEIGLPIVLCGRILLLAFLLLISHFVLRLLWSFYLVIRAGGTSFESKSAEELEEAALRVQLHMNESDGLATLAEQVSAPQTPNQRLHQINWPSI